MTLSHSNARRPHILLCSAWQIVNIGDIAHTPAALALLEEHFPEARVTLWPFRPLSGAATELLMRRSPDLQIVEGDFTPSGESSDADLQAARDDADFSCIRPARRCSAGIEPKRFTRAPGAVSAFMA